MKLSQKIFNDGKEAPLPAQAATRGCPRLIW
jgi:hypothetical protein